MTSLWRPDSELANGMNQAFRTARWIFVFFCWSMFFASILQIVSAVAMTAAMGHASSESTAFQVAYWSALVSTLTIVNDFSGGAAAHLVMEGSIPHAVPSFLMLVFQLVVLLIFPWRATAIPRAAVFWLGIAFTTLGAGANIAASVNEP